MSPWQQVAIAILALLGGSGGLVALVRALTDRPKVQADAASIITTSATAQMTAMERRLNTVEAKYEAVVALLDETRDQLDSTDRKAVRAEWRVSRLSRYQQRASTWHERHVPYDRAMGEIANQLQPGMLADPTVLDRIPPLEPFPHWEEYPGGATG
jgi:hypothetical protein